MEKADKKDWHQDQEDIDQSLNRGIFYSIIWIAGYGSIKALLAGIQGLREINSSRGNLTGKGKALPHSRFPWPYCLDSHMAFILCF